jgi:hypothetical protein
MTIDWSNPTAPNRLIAPVDLHAEARSIVATVNGHAIRKMQSRLGKMYQVGTTGIAFSAFEAAKKFASKRMAQTACSYQHI